MNVMAIHERSALRSMFAVGVAIAASASAWSATDTAVRPFDGERCAPVAETTFIGQGKEMQAKELLENPGFEDGLDSWSEEFGGRMALETASARSGGACVRVEREGADSGPAQEVTAKLKEHGQGPYKLTAWINLESGMERVSPVLRLKDAAGERTLGVERWCVKPQWTECSRILDVRWEGELESAVVHFQTNDTYLQSPPPRRTFSPLSIDDCSLTKFDEEEVRVVTVDAARDLGGAEQMNDFLSAMALSGPISADENHPYNEAWREIGLKHTSPCWDLDWLTVRKLTPEEADIDFTLHDEYMKGIRDILKSDIYVDVANKPRYVSSNPESPNYFYYMPSDLGEWELLLKAVVRHNVEVLGMPGLYYGAVGEPFCGEESGEYVASYSYEKTQDKATRLRNNIRLHAVSWRAIKSVDPTAKIMAPGNAWWKGGSNPEEAIFTIEEWFEALRDYNESVPAEERIDLDCVDYQDYAWLSDRLSVGAEVVSSYLAAYGFDPDTPKWVGWSDNYGDAGLTAAQRASHVMYNIIREFKDPAQRKFDRAMHYYFGFHPGQEALGDFLPPETQPTTLVFLKADGTAGYNPDAVPYQIAGRLAKEDCIVGTSSSEDLEAIATREGRESVTAVVNNNTPARQSVEVVFENLPWTASQVAVRVQRVGGGHSMDGDGLEEGEVFTQAICEDAARVGFQAPPYSTAVLTLSVPSDS